MPLLERCQLRRDLRLEPRRVLHGPRRRPEAPYRHRASPSPSASRPEPASAAARDQRDRRTALQRRARALRRPSSRSAGLGDGAHRAAERGTGSHTSEQERLSRYYRQQVFPVLTPLAVDPAHPFPYISGNSHEPRGAGGEPELRQIPLRPREDPRQHAPPRPRRRPDRRGEPARSAYGFITMENLIIAHLESLFPGMIIKEARSFRVTRNEDIDVEEDDAENLLNAMEKELLRRRFGPPIRLEISDATSPFLSQLLADQLGVNPEEVYRLPAPLDFTVLFELQSLDRPDLKNRPFIPTTNRQIAEVESSRAQDIFAAIRERDILLHHPYDSFSTSVQAFLAQAAADPTRAGHQADAVPHQLQLADHRRADRRGPRRQAGAGAGRDQGALRRGRQHRLGPQARTRRRARRLRHRRPQDPLQAHRSRPPGAGRPQALLPRGHRQLQPEDRPPVHGPRPAHLRPGGRSGPDPPVQPAERLRAEVQLPPPAGRPAHRAYRPDSAHPPRGGRRQAPARKPGSKSRSTRIVDEKTIDALYRASQAGVKIDIVERGICALKPGVPGMSDNIRVRSILGRFLEHSRIYAFCNSDGPQIGEGPISGPEVWIGSADLMHRNLDRRVEALVRVTAPGADRRADSLCGPADVRLHGLLAHAARRHVHPSFARRRRPPAGGQPGISHPQAPAPPAHQQLTWHPAGRSIGHPARASCTASSARQAAHEVQ